MGSKLYQLAHPWHWLTYGQNATGIAAIAAILALVGLYFYTRYTKRMMKVQEAIARASITPILVLQGQVIFQPSEYAESEASDVGIAPPKITKYAAVLKVRNVGEGAALFLKLWHQPVSDKFVLTDVLLQKPNGAQDGQSELTELIKAESTSASFFGFFPEDLSRTWLFVVEAIDSTNLRHQLQIQRTPISDAEAMSVSMVHQGPKTWG